MRLFLHFAVVLDASGDRIIAFIIRIALIVSGRTTIGAYKSSSLSEPLILTEYMINPIELVCIQADADRYCGIVASCLPLYEERSLDELGQKW